MPTQVVAGPQAPFDVLVAAATESSGSARGGLTERLRERYGTDLSIALQPHRPSVIANFVTTLDGVVSYQTPDAMGGGEISGFFEPDRFVMGLLRSLADVVLVGAGTVRAAPTHRWVPGHVDRAYASEFAAVRQQLGLAPQPLTAVVSESGTLDLNHPGLSDPAVPAMIITTDRGAARLAGHSGNIEVFSFGTRAPAATDVVELLARRGAQLVLSEGGPHLIGQLLSAKLLDELFLTVAPQVAGRTADTPRLALVEGAGFSLAQAPWFDLLDVRRSGQHLFTRYRTRGANHEA